MGLVYADLTIVSSEDIALARRGFIKQEDIRKAEVRALVDSGAYMMCINESLKTQLGLVKIADQVAELANGTKETYEVEMNKDPEHYNALAEKVMQNVKLI